MHFAAPAPTNPGYPGIQAGSTPCDGASGTRPWAPRFDRASDSDIDMPGTPSVRVDAAAAEEAMRLHASCPPEEERGEAWVAVEGSSSEESEAVGGGGGNQSATPTPPPPDGQQMMKRVEAGERASVEMLSPVSVEEKGEEKEREAPVLRRSYAGSSPSMSYEFSNVRLKPSSPSSFLRSGSQFRGTQHSERQVYEVQVEIKHVDMRESSLCGYLRIQGLTEDHPTLTTGPGALVEVPGVPALQQGCAAGEPAYPQPGAAREHLHALEGALPRPGPPAEWERERDLLPCEEREIPTARAQARPRPRDLRRN
ncbi:hypothetical protein V499_07261 [Pseudogymnoascus sp. VKM F-103]|nr:hypothetical protein V499_07261 [Pseudogymnoascus sp. VKM F-103]